MGMTEFKIKDNTTISKYDFDEVSLITEKVLDKTLGLLEKEGVFVFPELLKDAEDITKEQMIVIVQVMLWGFWDMVMNVL